MGYDAEPVLSNGYSEGQWKLTFNTIRFDDFCKLLAYTIFSYGYVNNTKDPFILMLNLNTEGNIICLNKIKKIIYKRLGRYLLDNRYTYSSINIFNEPIKNFMRKIIIISSPGYKNSELEELVNYTWEKDELKNITYEALDKNNMDPSVIRLNPYELKQFNKSNATMVTPNLGTIYTTNYNPEIFWANGCQFVLMNYQKIDTHFDKYISFFRKDSFIDKPLSQRGTTNKKKPEMVTQNLSSGSSSDPSDPLNYQNESCPKLPSENPIVGVDSLTFKDNYSQHGLCFVTDKDECDCDKDNDGECNFFSGGKVGTKKICCANKPIINTSIPEKCDKDEIPVYHAQQGSCTDDSTCKGQRVCNKGTCTGKSGCDFYDLQFLSKSTCRNSDSQTTLQALNLGLDDGKEKFDRPPSHDSNKSVIHVCRTNNGLNGQNICLIDKNASNSCPTGWDYTASIENNNGKICCRNT